MAEDVNNNVKIVLWPEKNKAMLEHSFNSEKPCPVSIVFDSPATIKFDTNPKEPLHVDMNMQLRTESLPVTFRLAEAICARSDYAVGIQFFDHHVATIRLAGLTKLFNCNSETGLCDVSGLAAAAAIPEVKRPAENMTHRTMDPVNA
jgi:hypothetical protein